MFEFTPDKLLRLALDTDIPPFDCGDPDLNDFLATDAKHYTSELLAVTYLVMEGGDVAAFFSLSNDKLTCAPDDTEAKGIWNRLQRKIPNVKRRRSYPAVKIGRLGVCADMQRIGAAPPRPEATAPFILTPSPRLGYRFPHDRDPSGRS